MITIIRMNLKFLWYHSSKHDQLPVLLFVCISFADCWSDPWYGIEFYRRPMQRRPITVIEQQHQQAKVKIVSIEEWALSNFVCTNRNVSASLGLVDIHHISVVAEINTVIFPNVQGVTVKWAISKIHLYFWIILWRELTSAYRLTTIERRYKMETYLYD